MKYVKQLKHNNNKHYVYNNLNQKTINWKSIEY